MAAKQANMTMEDELRNAFNVFDKDGSGYISSQELKQVRIQNTLHAASRQHRINLDLFFPI